MRLPAAIAMAACMVVRSTILRCPLVGQERPPRIAFALDSGTVTTDEAVSGQLIANGHGAGLMGATMGKIVVNESRRWKKS